MPHPSVLSSPTRTELLAAGIGITDRLVPAWAVVAVACGALALLTGWLFWRRIRRRTDVRRPTTPAVWIASVAAIGCTAYSADTSWRFAADYLDMGSAVERAAMFASAEFALFACALLARQNLNGPKQAPGLPGTLTWLITAVQILPAYAESGPLGGTVRAFVGPVMAAMLWHQAMGIELRHRRPEAASNSMIARIGREIRERVLSRLGVSERDRDAAQITRDRATRQAVALATRQARRTLQQRSGWRGRRSAKKLSAAIGRAQVGTDLRRRQELLAQLATRRHSDALATIDLPSPWGTPALDVDDIERAQEHPDPDHPSGRCPESHRVPTEAVPEQVRPRPQRTGRPPDATDEDLLAIGRTVVARNGEVSRKAVVDEVRRNRGLKASNERLKKVVDSLEAEFEDDHHAVDDSS